MKRLIAIVLLAGAAGCECGQVEPLDVGLTFTPSGYMGDGEFGTRYVQLDGNYSEGAHSAPSCIRISYEFGPKRWAGIHWQNKPKNWGAEPGTDFSDRGLSRLTFWARGELGGEVLEFKTGGIDDPNLSYSDGFEERIDPVTLSADWTQYTIDLSDVDLTSVISGFSWVASRRSNNGQKIVFFLDDIVLE